MPSYCTTCSNEGKKTNANYGEKGTSIHKYCLKHGSEKGFITHLNSTKCIDCKTKYAVCAKMGTNKREYCTLCAKKYVDYSDNINKNCIDCNKTRASFYLKGSKIL